MISGPVLPRTEGGLRELIDSHLDEIESGLVLLERDLDLESECRVDALAKDAAGRPVFVLLASIERQDELPARVLALRAWLASGAALLARFLAHDGVDYELPPRTVVLCVELSPAVLAQLHALRDPALEAYRLCSLRTGGRERGGLVPVLGTGDPVAADARQLPAGVRDPAVRTLGVRFLDFMQRLDAELQVRSDRYARSFALAGEPLAELRLLDGGLRVRVLATDGSAWAERELRTPADGQKLADLVMRRYLAVLRQERSPSDAVPWSLVSPARPSEPVEAPALSLGRLRAAVDTSHLSPEEYSVLGETGPVDD